MIIVLTINFFHYTYSNLIILKLVIYISCKYCLKYDANKLSFAIHKETLH